MSRIENQLVHEVKMQLKAGYGVSKHETIRELKKSFKDENNGSTKGFNKGKTGTIHSIKTAKSYESIMKQFGKYLKECEGVNKIGKVTRDCAIRYLNHMNGTEEGIKIYSGKTIKNHMTAINKVFPDYELNIYNVGLERFTFDLITKNRNVNLTEFRNNNPNVRDIIDFIKATGCRKESLTGDDKYKIITKNDINFKNGIAVSINLLEKNKKIRTAPILNEYKEFVTNLVRNKEGEDKVFENIPVVKGMPFHVCRAWYAQNLYTQLIQEKEAGNKFFNGDVVVESKLNYKDQFDSNGLDISHKPIKILKREYDRELLNLVSLSIGHNRLSFFINYSYKIL